MRNLKQLEAFPSELVEDLARLPGFRNVLMHDYVTLDYEIVIRALHELGPVEEFVRLVAAMESEGSNP